MQSKTLRVVLVAAACLGAMGASRLSLPCTTPTLATDTTSQDEGPSARDLLLHSGYMVAVG